MVHRGKEFARTAALGLALILAEVGGAAASESQADAREGHSRAGRPAGKPAYLWLWYADGKAIPEDTQYCGALGPPPAYECNFGLTGSGIEECQAQVQALLDAWYGDFNLVFTFTRPPTADYYTIVITSGWPRCAAEAADLTGGSAADEGGIAPGNYCNDNPQQTAIAIACGKTAHDCATIIAHEHGHLVGLVHTRSNTDVMNAWVTSSSMGFDSESVPTVQDLANVCELSTQNSHQRMLDAFGPWSGGPKPSPYVAAPDAGVADDASSEARDAASSGSPIGPGSRIDGGPIGVVGGYDALLRPTGPTVDAAFAPPKSGGGCSHVGARATAASVLLALLGLFLVALTRARVRCPARRARHAGEPLPCAGPARWTSAFPARGRRSPGRPRRR